VAPAQTHKHTQNIAFNSQDWRTHKRQLLDFAEVQLIHWKLCFYRMSCKLQLWTSDSSSYITTLLILKHAPLILYSTTQRKWAKTFHWSFANTQTHSSGFAFQICFFLHFNTSSLALMTYTVQVCSLSGYSFRDIIRHFRCLHWIPQHGGLHVPTYLHGDTRISLRTTHVCGINTTLLEGIGLKE